MDQVNPSLTVLSKGLMSYFTVIPDPKVERTKKHLLIDILAIAICAVVCGTDGWGDIEWSVGRRAKHGQQF